MRQYRKVQILSWLSKHCLLPPRQHPHPSPPALQFPVGRVYTRQWERRCNALPYHTPGTRDPHSGGPWWMWQESLMKRYGHSFPATKLNAKRIPKYLNISMQKGERSCLDDNIVTEEKEKTNPGPISCSKHYQMEAETHSHACRWDSSH